MSLGEYIDVWPLLLLHLKILLQTKIESKKSNFSWFLYTCISSNYCCIRNALKILHEYYQLLNWFLISPKFSPKFYVLQVVVKTCAVLCNCSLSFTASLGQMSREVNIFVSSPSPPCDLTSVSNSWSMLL